MLSLFILQKDKVYSEENPKSVAEKLFDKEVSMDVSHQFNQSPQQKPGIKTVLYQQKFQLGLKETEKKKRGSCQDFWDSTDGT